jgi:hypothetical protein
LSDDDATYESLGRIRRLFAVLEHIFEAEFDGFADVGQSIIDGFALRIAPGERGADDHIATVFVWLEEHFEVHDLHRVMLRLLGLGNKGSS